VFRADGNSGKVSCDGIASRGKLIFFNTNSLETAYDLAFFRAENPTTSDNRLALFETDWRRQ
jgi:hypothetical protein